MFLHIYLDKREVLKFYAYAHFETEIFQFHLLQQKELSFQHFYQENFLQQAALWFSVCCRFRMTLLIGYKNTFLLGVQSWKFLFAEENVKGCSKEQREGKASALGLALNSGLPTLYVFHQLYFS